jgi:GT2 family glycosyltransferase
MKTKISVVIPVYNGEKTIGECLNSVIKAEPKNKEIIVVDNNSQDKTIDIVKSFKKVKLLTEKRKGPAAARNKGLRKVKNEIVLLVDSDVVVRKDTFIELLMPLRDDSVAGVGGIAESYYRYNRIALSQNLRLFGNSIFDNKMREVETISSMVAAYKIKILQKIGYFSEDYYPSGEDVDLNYRIKKLGYKLLVNPLSRVYHKHPLTLKSLAKKWFDYGIGWAKFSKEHKKYFDLTSSIAWVLCLPFLIVLSLIEISFFPVFLFVFFFPWLIYYSLPTLRYFIRVKDMEVLIFPFVHQIQILSRSFGILYGFFFKT